MTDLRFLGEDTLGFELCGIVEGAVAVEVWVRNEKKTKLSRLEKGTWVLPDFEESHQTHALSMLKGRTPPVSPGNGLAGVLWTETNLKRVVWRDVRGLCMDDYQTQNERSNLYNRAGLHVAIAVPFSKEIDKKHKLKGLVILLGDSKTSMTRQNDKESLSLVAELVAATIFANRHLLHQEDNLADDATEISEFSHTGGV